jgi:DNA-binding transcriptional ArsR family regulator
LLGLRDGPKPVVELALELPVSRPAVSQHLRVLKDAGLVIAVFAERVWIQNVEHDSAFIP